MRVFKKLFDRIERLGKWWILIVVVLLVLIFVLIDASSRASNARARARDIESAQLVLTTADSEQTLYHVAVFEYADRQLTISFDDGTQKVVDCGEDGWFKIVFPSKTSLIYDFILDRGNGSLYGLTTCHDVMEFEQVKEGSLLVTSNETIARNDERITNHSIGTGKDATYIIKRAD